jgi:hypothetical protein
VELQFLRQTVDPHSLRILNRENESDYTPTGLLNLIARDLRVLIEKNIHDFPLKGVSASAHFPSPFLLPT